MPQWALLHCQLSCHSSSATISQTETFGMWMEYVVCVNCPYLFSLTDILRRRGLFLSFRLVLCLLSFLLLLALDPDAMELLVGARHAQGLVDAVFLLLCSDGTSLLPLVDGLDRHDWSGELSGQLQISLLTVALLGFAELLGEEDEFGAILLEPLDVGLETFH